MAGLRPIEPGLPAGIYSARESMVSLFELALTSTTSLQYIAERFPGEFLPDGEGGVKVSDDYGDFFAGKAMRFQARGAGEFIRIEVHPTDWYLELVAAIAGIRRCSVVSSHGWPILSLESGQPSVAEAGEAANLPGGGFST